MAEAMIAEVLAGGLVLLMVAGLAVTVVGAVMFMLGRW